MTIADDPATTAPGWVVIVEVDPVWHTIKGELADRPLPDPSTSTVPLFQHASLIGRTSQSRGLRPEVALDTDTAVSCEPIKANRSLPGVNFTWVRAVSC